MKEFEFEEDKEEKKEVPVYGTEEWEEYVMSQFNEKELYIDEKENKYPTLNGMRRVAISIFGKPSFSGPTKVETAFPISYCIYELDFSHIGVRVAATADAAPENVAGNYSIYPSAIAESRAEARAYRKLLLISTASAEEIKGNEKAFNTVLNSVKEYDSEGEISSQQISIIETKCKKLKINKTKFLESENVSVDFKDAKKSDGIKLSKKISEFQQKGIPEELKLN